MPKRASGAGPAGPSQRQLRVGELLRRTLSEILMRGDVHDPGLAGLSITVTEARMTPDLRRATVYVLPLGGEDPEGALAALERARGEIRHALASRTELKFLPELAFTLDRSFDRMDETRALFADPKVQRDVGESDAGGDGSIS